MSRPQVTITLGRTGQVVKRAGPMSDDTHSDYLPSSGNKRPIRERLGNVDNPMLYGNPPKNKRQRGENLKWSPRDDDVDDGKQRMSNTRINRGDLRLKLMRNKLPGQGQTGGDQHGIDLREKLSRTFQPPLRYSDTRSHVPERRSTGILGQIPPARSADDLPEFDSLRRSYSAWTLDGLRRRTPDRILSSSRRGSSPPRSMNELRHPSTIRSLDLSRPANPFVTKSPIDVLRPPTFVPKNMVPVEPAKPVSRLPPIPPPSGIVQKSAYMDNEPLTVAGLLHSLGLTKYAILFQAEEVDMTALKQMGDNDLKELGIPMGPRKKILLALLPRSKQRHA